MTAKTSGLEGREVLVCCAHGTADADGQQVVAAIVESVQAARPHVVVRAAFVDVQQPAVSGVVSQAVEQGARRVVVVPLLLSAGYHVHVDIAEAVAPHTIAVTGRALGPDVRLAQLLLDRLVEAGGREGDAVVLAAAGSSDARASDDVEHVAAHLRRLWAGPVTTGFGSGASPTVPDAVAHARASSARVLVASYLLAPGYFWSVLQRSGAEAVTAPLGLMDGDRPRIDSRLVDIVVDRFDEAPGQV